jgi:hypothetical protein
MWLFLHPVMKMKRALSIQPMIFQLKKTKKRWIGSFGFSAKNT